MGSSTMVNFIGLKKYLILTAVFFSFSFISAPVLAEIDNNTAQRNSKSYLIKSILAPYLMAFRVITGVQFGGYNLSDDFRSLSIKNLKFPTDVGPIYIKEIKSRDIEGPFYNQNTYKITYEVLGLRHDIDPEHSPLWLVEVAENTGVKMLQGDIVITFDYDFRTSDLKLAAILNLKEGGEFELDAELLNLSFNNLITVQNIVEGATKAGRNIADSLEFSASVEHIKLTFEEKGIKEKYVSYIANSEGQKKATVRRALPEKVAQQIKAVFPSTGNEAVDKEISNAIIEFKKLIKRGGILTASIVPEEPVSIQEISEMLADRDLEFLDLKIKHKNNIGAEELIFNGKMNKMSSSNDEGDEKLLAIRYLKGDGVPQNFRKGLKLIDEDEASNDPDTTFLLGSIYSQGIGTKVDFHKGYKFLLRSAALGHSEAIGLLDVIENKIAQKKLTDLQDEVFKDWLENKEFGKTIDVALTGNKSVIRELSLAFRNGDTVPRNYFQSYVWAIIGSALGDTISENLREGFWSASLNGKIFTSEDIDRAQKKAAVVWNTKIQESILGKK